MIRYAMSYIALAEEWAIWIG